MQNKIKLVMDDEKILHDGIYDLNSIHLIIDDLLVNRKGLRKDGNFYIDDNPSDSAGVGMACIFTLAGKKWFRENGKPFESASSNFLVCSTLPTRRNKQHRITVTYAQIASGEVEVKW